MSSPGSLPEGTYAVALHIESEAALRSLSERLSSNSIDHRLIIESEGPHAGEAMAIGIVPLDRKRVKKLLSMYPLIKSVRSSETRASRVMTSEAVGLNPTGRATSNVLVAQSVEYPE